MMLKKAYYYGKCSYNHPTNNRQIHICRAHLSASIANRARCNSLLKHISTPTAPTFVLHCNYAERTLVKIFVLWENALCSMINIKKKKKLRQYAQSFGHDKICLHATTTIDFFKTRLPDYNQKSWDNTWYGIQKLPTNASCWDRSPEGYHKRIIFLENRSW